MRIRPYEQRINYFIPFFIFISADNAVKHYTDIVPSLDFSQSQLSSGWSSVLTPSRCCPFSRFQSVSALIRVVVSPDSVPMLSLLSISSSQFHGVVVSDSVLMLSFLDFGRSPFHRGGGSGLVDVVPSRFPAVSNWGGASVRPVSDVVLSRFSVVMRVGRPDRPDVVPSRFQSVSLHQGGRGPDLSCGPFSISVCLEPSGWCLVRPMLSFLDFGCLSLWGGRRS
ncbi:hypothetical protein EVAR_30338_1 [Eumeta japonica]|uniref:Uncharacterized protein n=1 Tax=Eumeta variegata TaxID=151549 RepID=A0A4C1WBU3_EUMVA|nr:hypothetical protein EVAR_30338_1 [Eumeta japonica]